MICNGTTPLKIKTLHGPFEFRLQRFIDREHADLPHRTYFDLTDQFQEDYVSDRLKEFSAYYSNRLSYIDVSGLIERVTGFRQLSDQKIHHVVVEKAQALSQACVAQVEETLSKTSGSVIDIDPDVDIYDPESREILIFEDAIQVRGQKENRIRKQSVINKEMPEKSAPKKTSAVSSDVILFENKDGDLEYLTAPIDRQGKAIIPVADVLKSRVIEDYGKEENPLPIVAITDGAKIIREHLWSVFGITVFIILDWYHLGKKLRDLMSMIALNKDEKNQHLKFMFYHLWRGDVFTVLNYLVEQVQPKNVEKHLELINYLEKHQHEIIDYRSRKIAGKPIGSGSIEKGCDQVIGRRQKKKGMSWRPAGSRSLGILKVIELNNEWDSVWFPQEAANDASNLRLVSNA